MQEVTVRSPATVANVVCGFDCLGFALSEPYDEITVRKIDEPGIKIVNVDEHDLPTNWAENVSGVALKALLSAANIAQGIEIISQKNIKPGSGIGSSSASAAGVVVAANHLLGEKFSQSELVNFAMEGEKLASGSRHADNVSPCIFGGFTLVRSTEPLDVIQLHFATMWATVIHPQIEIKTSEARALLPQMVSLKDAVKNWSNLGAFVSALAKNDHETLGRAMTDAIVEPARQDLIPHFADVKAASLKAGAIGGGISGSGPSMFMLSASEEVAVRVESAMTSIYASSGYAFNTYVSAIDRSGVAVISSR